MVPTSLPFRQNPAGKISHSLCLREWEERFSASSRLLSYFIPILDSTQTPGGLFFFVFFFFFFIIFCLFFSLSVSLQNRIVKNICCEELFSRQRNLLSPQQNLSPPCATRNVKKTGTTMTTIARRCRYVLCMWRASRATPTPPGHKETIGNSSLVIVVLVVVVHSGESTLVQTCSVCFTGEFSPNFDLKK